MKRPIKLSLAVALALAGGNAFALGLGAIQVRSGLNQPLDAEIPVITESAAEANALTVDLASAEDFERIGLSRSRLTVPIEMTVGTNARGQTVIKLSTKEAVREPLLDFLLVANWSKGKLLREYTVLLDPPITAPAKSAATVAPLAEKPVPVARPLTETRTEPAPPPAKVVRAEPRPPVAAPAPKPAPKQQAKAAPPPPPPAPPAPKPAAHPASNNDYGPVAEGETLSGIARATKPDDKTSVDQMMLALLKANPKAFYQDNINALKRGSILRIPSNDELHASASLREAAEQVHNQNEAWSGRAPVSKPTLVAHAGAAAKPAEPTAMPAKTGSKPAKQERLALVPPTAGKTDSTTDRAGAAGGTGKDNADVRAELARTKEALTSREQESAELKSRVKQLEEISTKDQRLISMKDSEIADLQKKLRDLQAKSAAPVAAVPAKPAEAPSAKAAETAKAADTATTKPDQKLTAKDIWGDLNGGEKNAAKPATATATPPAATPTTATTSTEPAAAAPPVASTASSSPPTMPASTPATNLPATTTESPASTATASATAPAATAPVDANATVKATPVKSPPAAKVTPLAPAAEPFYKNQSVLLGGGAALLLVGLLALMRFMRKPKPAFAPSDDAFDHGEPEAGDDEELRLRDALQQNPGNTAASLELLRHYYSQGDATKFEAAAETMHAHLPDPAAPEWDEVLAMGAVLAPNHPLFSDVAEHAAHHDTMFQDTIDHDTIHHAAEHYDTLHGSAAVPAEEFTYPGQEHLPVEQAQPHFDAFEVEPVAEASAPPAAHDDSFDFDLPMQTEETVRDPVVVHHEPEPLFTEAAAPTPVVERQDDIYVGEDAIGTKLDLAKAYLDMGDPEGAKSMLDEVLAEGNDSQRDEARRLLAEIH